MQSIRVKVSLSFFWCKKNFICSSASVFCFILSILSFCSFLRCFYILGYAQISSCSTAYLPGPALRDLTIPSAKLAGNSCSLFHSPFSIQPVLRRYSIHSIGNTKRISPPFTRYHASACFSCLKAASRGLHTTTLWK